MIPTICLGAGGHAKGLIEILGLDGRYELMGILDPRTDLYNGRILGLPILGGDELLPALLERGIRHGLVGLGGVGHTGPRETLYRRVVEYGLEPVSVVHPSAIISGSARLGRGVNILAGVIVGADAEIGDNVIVNSGAIVEHDCTIENHSHLASGCMLGGGVRVLQGAHIGLGASVRQGICVGRRAVVAAGAVVVRDVPDQTVVAGVPAKTLELK